MTQKYYAHSLKEKPINEWQPLDEHLKNVAKLAAEFARPFGGDNWSWQLDYNHDVGKGTLPWQAYLRHANEIIDDFMQYYTGRVEHAALGAQASDRGRSCRKCLTFNIKYESYWLCQG